MTKAAVQDLRSAFWVCVLALVPLCDLHPSVSVHSCN